MPMASRDAALDGMSGCPHLEGPASRRNAVPLTGPAQVILRGGERNGRPVAVTRPPTGHRDASAHEVLRPLGHSAWSIRALAAFSWPRMCSGVSPRASDMDTTALRLPSSVTPLRVM